ncbi:MAG: YajQ family cyclic di-GMP-binding protein [Acidobacteria bacterium]|nr:YajQ family cyclic di-GMP-binding protein [Acidobacteriota bacterium]
MPSFDIVVKTDLQEVDNAVNQAMKEIGQRFDFRGSKSRIDWDKKGELTVLGDDDYKLTAVLDVLKGKMVRRGLSIKNLDYGKAEPAFDGTVRQKITVQQELPTETAKEIVKILKQAKLKVQAAIREGEVRVTGKKRDDLQEAIALIKEQDLGMDFQYTNFRD